MYYNGLIEQSVRATGKENIRLIDVHAAIQQSENGIRRFINQNDGHHITAEGHQLYADLLVAMLQRECPACLGVHHKEQT